MTQTILRWIRGHFDLEARLKYLAPDERLCRRQAEALPLLESLHALLLEQKAKLLPKAPLAQAIGYTLHQWAERTLFTVSGHPKPATMGQVRRGDVRAMR